MPVASIEPLAPVARAATAVRILILLSVAAAGGCALMRAEPPEQRLPPKLELERFSGRWHVIAATDGFVDTGTVGATVEFEPAADGSLAERRRGHPGGFDQAAVGEDWRLTPLDAPRRTLWRADSAWPFGRERWVLYVDPGYRLALLGDEGGEAQVLARDRELPEWTYAGLLARLAEAGYDVTELHRVPQRPEDVGRPGHR